MQATVTYRVIDPALATTRVDFGVDPETGAWNAVPLDTLGGLLTELAQQPAVERVAAMTMREALAVGIAPIRQQIAAALAGDLRLAERGIAVTDVRVVAIRTDPDVERAMQTEYLDGQPVVGINPEPDRHPGVLVPHPAEATAALLAAAAGNEAPLQRRTMVTATTDDGQQLQAVNEVYVGHRSHQSARYRIETSSGTTERQSSSGVLAGTGTGATGWLRSAWQERRSVLALPEPTAPELCWFVREAWPSVATGTELTEGLIAAGAVLRLHAESDELVCFGDGIESDALRLSWGQTLSISAAELTLNLVV